MNAAPEMRVQLVVFSAPKEGYAPWEWEDGASADPLGGRFIVVDGATESYEARRWVDQLVGSFMSRDARGGGQPELSPAGLQGWIEQTQARWRAETAPGARDYIEREKLREGALATFLGGHITGLDSPSPAWHAAALGDTVLFHVRGRRLLAQFPRLSSAEFGLAPEGISTRPDRLGRMSSQMLFAQGRMAPGDIIYGATDAFAKWMIEGVERRDQALWPLLDSLSHPAVFGRIVDEQRSAGAMKDDDVTLMRVRILTEHPSALAVFL